MRNKNRIFLYVTLCIFFADALFVAINYYNDKKNLYSDLEHQSRQYRTSFEVALSMTTANMAQLATYVANDPSVQTSFLKAKQAFKMSGYQVDDALTNIYRTELYNKVKDSWNEMRNQFYVRQLHFHIAPDTSLLRVHKPEKWGDDLSPLRHMIVDTMGDHKARQGFELGRIYAGIRGTVPVYEAGRVGQSDAFIGVLEAGTSFSEIIGTLKGQIGAEIAVLLDGDRVSDVKWKNGEGGVHKDVCGCFLEAESSAAFVEVLEEIDLARYREDEPFKIRTEVVALEGKRQMLTSFGFHDYIGERDKSERPVGRMVMWSDVDHKFQLLRENTTTNILYAIIGFILIETLIYIGMRAASAQLKSEVARQASEIRDLLDRALEANKAKNEFLANMSHELRTPMMGIRGSLDLLKSKPDLESEVRQTVTYLDNSSTALMSLVDDILDLSKIESGKLALDVQPCEPQLHCQEVYQTFKASAAQKGLELIFTNQGLSSDWYEMDGLRFRQILSNLVNNAIKFTQNGFVEISLQGGAGSECDYLVVRVTDTGIGMSADQMKTVFERFSQADGSTSRKYGGTGLGLAISNELTRLLGGDLTVTSELGEGAQFTLSLPVTPCATPDCVDQEDQVLPGLRILFAEDNMLNQRVTKVMLEKYDHDVDVASNGIEAVDLASKRAYDLILMDVQMPEMDGLEATRRIRAGDGPNKQVAIIAFTADAIADHLKEFLKSGFDSVVVKPVRYEMLQRKMQMVLDRSSDRAAE